MEPFFGSGGVFFNKNRSNIETINDLDGEVINLFECIKSDPERLARDIYFTPYARASLARYIAHKAELPFAYVRFSSVVDSHLGGTQSNLAKIFEYVRTNPCVLCFDEIDAIGTARGQAHEMGEMNRVVIAIMQELDQTRNNAIIIGTTNRFDQLDPALVRRFPLRYELTPLSPDEVRAFAHRFFRYAGLPSDGWVDEWCGKTFEGAVPASTVVRECTDVVVKHILQEEAET